MAASTFIIFVFLWLFIQQTSGEVICEKLPTDVCAFSIDSSGKRCLLETYSPNSDNPDSIYSYKCMTSEVKVEIKMSDYVETEECVRACGVDRNWVGISSDALLDTQFTAMLCSSSCYQNCPNIVDLYSNLAAGEGEVICEKLPTDVCAFSIDSSGKRYLLETYSPNSDNPNSIYSYKCMTSEVKVEIKMSDYVETEECIRACGVNRNWVGISSDALLDTQFTAMLCSSSCYQNCPNIVDLYSNLAAGEG